MAEPAAGEHRGGDGRYPLQEPVPGVLSGVLLRKVCDLGSLELLGHLSESDGRWSCNAVEETSQCFESARHGAKSVHECL